MPLKLDREMRYFFHDEGGFYARWASYGYDLEAAAKRRNAFYDTHLNPRLTDRMAARLVSEFEAREKRIAIESGIPEDDPDLWRFDAAPKYFG